MPGAPRRRAAGVATNKAQGAHFEALFAARARAEGMLALKNELAFRYKPGGGIRPIRADLDFRVLSGDGRIAYLDCKCRTQGYIAHHDIDKAQLQRAVLYHHYGIAAGFVVWLMESKRVIFLSAQVLATQVSKRYTVRDGMDLGPPECFSLRRVFRPVSARVVTA